MTHIETEFTPSPRPHLGIPKDREHVEASAQEIADGINHITELRGDEGYAVELVVTSFRAKGVATVLVDRYPELADSVEVDLEPSKATFHVTVETAITALGVVDAFLDAAGYCRVCGEIDCVEGYIYTDTDVVHRTEMEPPHDDEPVRPYMATTLAGLE